MNHYFTDNRQLEHNRKEISFRFSCFNYLFTTDSGVFSKNQVDFGTHTLLSIVSEGNIKGKILDLGCGYGPVGVVLKNMFNDCEVHMYDINPRAVELAKINVELNKVDCLVDQSDGFENIRIDDYSNIIFNPPIRTGKENIYKMFEQSYEHLISGGSLWIVIQKKQGGLSAKAKISSIFGNCEIIGKEKGYLVLKSTKYLDNLL